jgi:hypothetical protein
LVGLVGDQLTLKLGEEELTLSSNGAFAFDQELTDGSPVSVEVIAAPQDPDQECTLEGPAQIMGEDAELMVSCQTPIRHVIVLGIDGFGGHFVGEVATPRMDALREESVWTLAMQNGLPTSSSTNWMSMIGGSTPDQHGVLDNGWQPGDSTPPPTLFATFRAANPDAKIGVFHDWADFYRLVENDVTDIITHPGDELETMEAALSWIVAERPELTFIHLDHVDHAGHFNTWGSPAYHEAGELADSLLGELIDELIEFDLWPYTALIVSADHGGVGLAHGADTPQERPIPFIVRRPQGPSSQITREVRVWDIAATVLELLEVEAPADWVGRPVDEVFTGFADSTRPSGDLIFATTSAFDQLWTDEGTLAWSNVSVWRPSPPVGFFAVGDVTVGDYFAPEGGTLVLRSDDPLALASPIAYEEVWNSAGANGDADASFWNPIPPPGYACLGTVAGPAPGVPPELDLVRCVHLDYLLPAQSSLTWEDSGSGASWDGSFWQCQAGGEASLVPGAFVTRRHHTGPGFPKCFGLDPERVSAE